MNLTLSFPTSLDIIKQDASLGLVIETWTFSVSVSSLRLRPFKAQFQSGYWDSDIFSLGLDDPNVVTLIPKALETQGLKRLRDLEPRDPNKFLTQIFFQTQIF